MDKLMRLVVAVQLRLVGAVDQKEKGATATEYALLVALIAVVIATAVGVFGTNLSTFFNGIANSVTGWTTSLS